MNREVPAPSLAPDRLIASGLAILLFALYAAGSSRTIYVGDSGELVTAVYLLGIPHPSGYPLYVMLGKLWTLIVPAGSVAFRMSLFSAACAAGACAILYVIGRAMRLSRGASLLAALLLAFAPSFWAEANIQRVYTLNALFLALVTWAAWRWHDVRRGGGAATWTQAPGDGSPDRLLHPASAGATPDVQGSFPVQLNPEPPDRTPLTLDGGLRAACPERWLVLAFFLCGLGASNHLFMGPAAVCLGIFAVLRAPALLYRPRVILASGAAFAIGLLPYLYLPLRSRMNPRLDWGNPETLRGFMDVVGRGDFWERAWIEGPMDLLAIGLDYLKGLGGELAWIGLALMLAGLLAWRKLGIFVVFPVMVMCANLASMALHGSRVDIFVWHRYYIPSYLMAALLAGAGWDLIASRLAGSGKPAEAETPEAGGDSVPGASAGINPVKDPGGARMPESPALGFRQSTAVGSGSSLAPGHQETMLRRGDPRQATPARAGLVWRALPCLALALPGLLLVTGWSRFDRSRYRVSEAFSRTVLESLPPGAHLIATDDNILFTSMYLHLVEGVRPDVNLILQGVGGAQLPPLKFNPDEDPVHFTHHPNWNQPGLEIVPVGLTFRAWREGRPWPEPMRLPELLEGEDDPRVPRDHLTQNLIGHFHYMKGVTLETKDWLAAAAEFLDAAEAAPDNDVLYYNLGLIYRRSGLLPEALEWFRRSQAINPRHLASHDRPRASDKVTELVEEAVRLEEVERSLLRQPSLAGLEYSSPEWHLAMASLLEPRGYVAWARGHLLRARERSSRATPALP